MVLLRRHKNGARREETETALAGRWAELGAWNLGVSRTRNLVSQGKREGNCNGPRDACRGVPDQRQPINAPS